MVDDFEVKPIFENRPHERHQFAFVINDKKFKGDYCDGEIHWLHPHPKQEVGERKIKAIEAEIHELLGEHGIDDTLDDIEIEPMLNRKVGQVHLFKLKIRGEAYKGTFSDGELEWFHPKPRRKLADAQVEKVEEQVQEKMKDHIEKQDL